MNAVVTASVHHAEAKIEQAREAILAWTELPKDELTWVGARDLLTTAAQPCDDAREILLSLIADKPAQLEAELIEGGLMKVIDLQTLVVGLLKVLVECAGATGAHAGGLS